MPRNGSKEDTDGVVVMGDGVAAVGGKHWVIVNGDNYYTLISFTTVSKSKKCSLGSINKSP